MPLQSSQAYENLRVCHVLSAGAADIGFIPINLLISLIAAQQAKIKFNPKMIVIWNFPSFLILSLQER
jgi:hypothetical protein